MAKPSLPRLLLMMSLLNLGVFGILLGLMFEYVPGLDVSVTVLIWWAALCAVSVFNLGAWGLVQSPLAGPAGDLRPRQQWLSLVFVLGCAFRSYLPRADVKRICLVNHWLSTVLVGRAVATVAELCFVTQWALLLGEYAASLDAPGAVRISKLIVPLIAVAETCSWYAVVTTNYIGNVFEQSIWVLTASVTAITAISLWRRGTVAQRRVFLAAFVFTIAFVVFMCTVNVPMYLARWRADEAAHKTYLSLGAGLHDLATRRVVTYSWRDWHEELSWMGLYFSVAVWTSIAMMRFPHPRQAVQSGNAPH